MMRSTRMQWKRIIFFIFCLCVFFQSQSQFTQELQYPMFNYFNGLSYASGLSCYDFNKDGWDDITVATYTDGVRTFLNNEGTFEEVYLFNSIPGQVRGCTWIDFDNDDDADLFVTRYNNAVVIMRNDGDLSFTDISYQTTMPSVMANSHGVSWGDYDRDGLADAYVCNYHIVGNIKSWLFHNLGNGEFEDVGLLLNVSNGVKAAFQSSWVDIDHDLDPDLMVVNDRYFGNSFYRNNGDGSFTNAGAETGLNVALDGMGVAWSDLDHDLDYDLYISNTDSGGVLLMNEDGIFQNVAEQSNLEFVGATLYGVEWLDYDNNTWDDFYGATNTAFDGGQNYFYINSNDGYFNGDNSPDFENDDGECYVTATGDFNRDGYSDLVVVNITPQKIAVWLNNAIGGNWIKLHLQGTVSNHDAIGSHIHVYVDGREYITYTQSGESFLGQDSQYEIIGIGDATTIDSIKIEWPLGWTDMIYNPSINTTLHIIEGISYSDEAEHYNLVLCQNDSLLLTNSSDSEGLWSNGVYASELIVQEPGVYEQVITIENGFDHHIFYDVVLFESGLIVPEIIPVSCFGAHDGMATLALDTSLVSSILWSNATSGITCENLGPGAYELNILYENSCDLHVDFVVTEPPPLMVQSTMDTVCEGMTSIASLVITGGSGNYIEDWFGDDPNALTVGVHHYQISDLNGCMVQDSLVILEYTPIDMNWEIPMACFGESVAVEYVIEGPTDVSFIEYNDVDPAELFAGIYEFIIVDENGCFTIEEITVNENPPLLIEAQITHANSTNNGNIELEISGGTPPYDILWQNGSDQWILDELSEGIYEYTITDGNGCQISDEVEVLFDFLDEFSSENLIYPNPCHDVLFIDSMAEEIVVIFDLSGKRILSQQIFPGQNQLNISTFPSGFYFLKSTHLTTPLLIH